VGDQLGLAGVHAGRVVIDRPAWARAEGIPRADLEKLLGYRDQRAAYELQRFRRNPYNFQKYPAAEFDARVEALKAQVDCNLLQEVGGMLRFPAGLAVRVANALGVRCNDFVAARLVDEDGPPPFEWHRDPDKTLRPYQRETVELLKRHRHAAAALSVGMGKTLVALHLVRELGERAIVMSPSSSIVEQTYDEFVSVLGRRRVGQYGAGRKDTKEDVLICTTQALLRVTGSPAERSFRSRRVIVGDEAHGLAADAFSKICLDLLADAPYRLFLSGTLARHDGLQPLLDGVVGPTVKTMTLRDGVAGGFLVAPSFRMVGFRNGRDCTTGDPGKATQEALYRSPAANALAGALANQMVDAGRPVLVFVDELDQFARLLPYLRHEARFAHGGADKKRLVDKVPAAHHAAEALDLVRRFNNKEFPVLVGTSCLRTGVDIRATGAALWLAGGKSINDLGQGVGRLVRLFDGKTDAVWLDLDPLDGGIAHRHAEAREKAYGDIYPDVQRLVLGE
jgi:superfamily II DNA or RNA helicase